MPVALRLSARKVRETSPCRFRHLVSRSRSGIEGFRILNFRVGSWMICLAWRSESVGVLTGLNNGNMRDTHLKFRPNLKCGRHGLKRHCLLCRWHCATDWDSTGVPHSVFSLLHGWSACLVYDRCMDLDMDIWMEIRASCSL